MNSEAFEELAAFKAYQRGILWQLTAIREALSKQDYTTAEKLTKELIEDTQANLCQE